MNSFCHGGPECPDAESIDFQSFRGLFSGEVSNISPLLLFPSHPIFSVMGQDVCQKATPK